MKRVVGIATIQGREEALSEAVKSLIPQVDEIHIYKGTEHPGDAFKFKSYRKDCHFFPCDDDLIYPPDYCDKMIERYNYYLESVPGDEIVSDCIITCHGKVFNPPITHYHRSAIKFRCLDKVDEDVTVDAGGTGCMLITGQLNFSIEDFKEKNMADVWIAKFAHEQKIPIVCMAHKKGWIQYTTKVKNEDTIYAQRYNNCETETRLINEMLNDAR